MTTEKTQKLKPQEMLAAIATVANGIQDYLNNKEQSVTEKEAEKPYWLECRLNDAVKIRFKDNKLFCQYTVEILNPLRLGFKHEATVDGAFSDILQYIKKGYKSITGSSLSLNQQTDIMEHVVQSSARRQIRSYIAGYTISGMESDVEKSEKETKELLQKALDKADKMTVFKKKAAPKGD